MQSLLRLRQSFHCKPLQHWRASYIPQTYHRVNIFMAENRNVITARKHLIRGRLKPSMGKTNSGSYCVWHLRLMMEFWTPKDLTLVPEAHSSLCVLGPTSLHICRFPQQLSHGLVPQTNLGLHWNLGFTFIAPHSILSGPLCRSFEPVMYYLVLMAIWNCGARLHNPLNLSFVPAKPAPCGWHCQVTLPAQDEVWTGSLDHSCINLCVVNPINSFLSSGCFWSKPCQWHSLLKFFPFKWICIFMS